MNRRDATASASLPRVERRQHYELSRHIALLESQLRRTEAQRDEALSLFEHERASFATYKKQHAKEIETSKEVGQAILLKALLPVLDNFERALFHGELNRSADEPVVRGIRLTYDILQKTLAGFGIEKMDTVGKPYDPEIHEAVDKLVTAEQPENTIVEEFEGGYSYKGTLLRPAKVRVAVRSEKASARPST